ncbi:MAG: pentapeptide repeat-containing protein, partial [Nocardioides sp.]
MAEFGKEDLSGSTFDWTDLSGSVFDAASMSDTTFRATDFYRVSMRGVELFDVDISGEIRGLVINGVDVTDYVQQELVRRDPLLGRLGPDDREGFLAAWGELEGLWKGTVNRAQALEPDLLDESVDEEWSFIQTLRHLMFATSCWV